MSRFAPSVPSVPSSLLLAALLSGAALSGGCASQEYTWHADVGPIVEAKCAGCHQAGEIAPFSLTSYEEVAPLADLVASVVADGTMPPWQPDNACNDYQGDTSLSEAERVALLDWVEAGAPEGRPADAAEPLPTPAPPWTPDLQLPLPSAYTPPAEGDDYRCQLIPWPLEEPAWITGVRVIPDQRAIVHHTILYAVSAEDAAEYRAMDEAEEGPGYTCYGGARAAGAETTMQLPEGMTMPELLELLAAGELPPGMAEQGLGGQRWLGAWVPGAADLPFPEGTGLRMEPGDLVIAQMHYNTASAFPVEDRSEVAFLLEEEVERPAYVMPLTDLGWVSGLPMLGEPMTIPAGDPAVQHTSLAASDGLFFNAARQTLGLPADAPLAIHQAAHHMHQLGTWARQRVVRADGGEQCMLEIPEWDFSWQSAYRLQEPVVLYPGDSYEFTCAWDNSAANQPIVDGQQMAPRDVEWGEGTTDEMCLATLYLTAAE